jgi:chromate reductase, NAD(P)H dehydrogenase (quinone)
MSPFLIVAGTNRPASNAARVADHLLGLYRELGAAAEVFSLSAMPPECFTPDAYARKPAPFLEVQAKVLAAPGLHVVTPEYNGSYAGVLKVFIDLLKFPESFEHKPVAFVGEASGEWGGLRAVEHLQQVFAYRNAHLFPPRVFINRVHTRFQGDALTDADLADRLRKQVEGFVKYAKQVGY